MQLYDAVEEISKTLSEGIGKTTERLEKNLEELDFKEVFEALVGLADLKAQVRDVETRLNILLTTHMRLAGDKILEFGDMVAERKFNSSRKNWSHQVLMEVVVNQALAKDATSVVDPSTGEIIDLSTFAKPIIDSVVEHLTRAAAIREWRVTALKAMVPGLNPDDYCEVEKSERVSIRQKK